MIFVCYVRSGDVDLNRGRSSYSGVDGFGWSSRSYSTATSAYYLGFNATVVYPSVNTNRWHGYPLRCLAD